MNPEYKVFTVKGGVVEEGAEVVPFELTNGTAIPAIVVGESGRGRKQGVLPVSGVTLANGGEPVRVMTAEIGQSQSGRPKLVAGHGAIDTSAIVGVLRTPIGFRGSNKHTGDSDESGGYLPFPGQILVEGVIAQGAAGAMGSGKQYDAILPQGVVFRTGYAGRLYGAPSSHFYKWDGEQLLVATLGERELADLF